MAPRERKFRLYNRIWFLVVSLVLTILTLWGLGDGLVYSALALEQETRCGMVEHIHTDECYIGNVLVCSQKAHTHSESCYLILLEENDINTLLTVVDSTEDKSLETAIQSTLTQALAAEGVETDADSDLSFEGGINPSASPSSTPTPSADPTPTPSRFDDPTPTPSRFDDPTPTPSRFDDPTPTPSRFDDPTPTPSRFDDPEPTPSRLGASTETEEGTDVAVLALTNLSVTDLNTTIAEGNIEPALTLNENLYAVSTLSAPTDTAAIADDGVSTLAVGDTASTSNQTANIYIYLDGAWKHVGTLPFEVTSQSIVVFTLYTQSVNNTDILNFLNNVVDPDYSALSESVNLYYTSTGADSWSSATIGDNSTQFGSSNTLTSSNAQSEMAGAIDVHVVSSSASSGTDDNLKFWTVTFVHPDGTQTTQIIRGGQTITLPAADGYSWVSSYNNTSYSPGEISHTIEAKTTFTAVRDGLNVTFNSQGGSAVDSQTVTEGEQAKPPTAPTRTGYTFDGWYTDAGCTDGNEYDFSNSVTKDITLYAKWKINTYEITYKGLDGNTIQTVTREHGQSLILEALPDGATTWTDVGYAVHYDPGDTIVVERDYVFRASTMYTVTLVDTDGTVISTESFDPGTTYTLEAPDGAYVWEDEDGHTYNTETEFTVNSNRTFTRKGYLTVNYAVNWNSSSASDVSITSGSYTTPTVMGGSTYSHVLTQGTTETVCDVSDEEVTVQFPLTSDNKDRPGIAVFQGWQVTDSDGTTHTFQPGEVCTYSELEQYADSDGEVTLTGLWMYAKGKSVTFFVEYDSQQNSSADANQWTPVLYVNYYSGNENITTGNVGDQDGDGDVDNYDVDAKVRSMVATGEFSSFPTDEYVFEILKNYTDTSADKYLEVDGIAVDPDDLNEHGYSILWTALKYISADGDYHLDGILVRKGGYINVTKTFSGNADAIDAVKNGNFTITAVSQEDGESLALNLAPYDADDNPTGYTDYDSATDTYTWKIPGVVYGEKWKLTESGYTVTVNGTSVAPYMEYTVTDALGGQSTHDEYDGPVTVTGQTYDDTIATDEVLTVSFSNIYPGTDSFILKKEDIDTGNALAGASFSLYQNGELLRFDYSGGIYTCTKDGTVTELDCTTGFLEITVEGLDFSQGSITVRETQTPEGYITLAGEVELTKSGDSILVSGENTGARMSNGVLIIGNTATTAQVTVTKQWANANDARDVIVNLMANGKLFTTLFPDLTNVSAVVTLTASGDYEYTWTDLPAYADGELIDWSVAETRIGEERVKSDGSFDNWTVVYSKPSVTTDSDGNTFVELTVTNAKKSGNTLMLLKTDKNATALSGAQFLLQMLTESGSVSTDFAAQTGTTDSSGLLTFTGLPYGTYQLTETLAPAGYFGADVIRFTVNSDQSITILQDGGGAASVPAGSNLVLKVENMAGEPLPETGGSGTQIYTGTGALLMLAALALLVYQKSRRREVDLPDV